MSRAKKFTHDGEEIWFNKKARATVEQLELLADYEGLEIDDLLDEGLTQGSVVKRLYEATTHVVPPEVLERRRRRQLQHGKMAACRICTLHGWECEGRITRHHFVPRWLMLELDSYQNYAARSMCTIPICIGRHRDLHIRDEADKGIVPYLRPHERRFAAKMLEELQEEHPKIISLMASGDFHSYEYQLIRDWQQGLLLKDDGAYDLDEYEIRPEADLMRQAV